MFSYSQCSSYTVYFASAVLFCECITHVSLRVFHKHRPLKRLPCSKSSERCFFLFLFLLFLSLYLQKPPTQMFISILRNNDVNYCEKNVEMRLKWYLYYSIVIYN